jgi:hypothetical protein
MELMLECIHAGAYLAIGRRQSVPGGLSLLAGGRGEEDQKN